MLLLHHKHKLSSSKHVWRRPWLGTRASQASRWGSEAAAAAQEPRALQEALRSSPMVPLRTARGHCYRTSRTVGGPLAFPRRSGQHSAQHNTLFRRV